MRIYCTKDYQKMSRKAAGIIGGRSLKYSRPKSTRDDDNFTVVDQYPKAGTKVKKNSVVYVYKN